MIYYAKLNGEYIAIPKEPVELTPLSEYGLEAVRNSSTMTFELIPTAETLAAFRRLLRMAILDGYSNNWLKMHGYPKRRKI